MSRYDLIYMRDHCIDLYFRYKGKFFHVLTYGTTIPQILDNVEANRALQHQMAVRIDEWQGNGEVHIEQGYVFKYNVPPLILTPLTAALIIAFCSA